jgi:hypothetical protein
MLHEGPPGDGEFINNREEADEYGDEDEEAENIERIMNDVHQAAIDARFIRDRVE